MNLFQDCGQTVIRCIAMLSAIFLFLPPDHSRAETSVIKNILDASKAIVTVKAEAGGVFGEKPQGFLDKATGQILMMQKVAPVYFESSGAGFILDPSGIVVTNAHIVGAGGRVTVTLQDNTVLAGTPIQVIPGSDIAFVKINPPQPLPVLPLANSDTVKLDTPVYTTGNSTLIRGSISEGSVSGIGTRSSVPGVAMLQINFTMYKGDSGCPILNSRGELLGMISAQSRPNVIFAIPANAIKQNYLAYLAKNPAPAQAVTPAAGP